MSSVWPIRTLRSAAGAMAEAKFVDASSATSADGYSPRTVLTSSQLIGVKGASPCGDMSDGVSSSLSRSTVQGCFVGGKANFEPSD